MSVATTTEIMDLHAEQKQLQIEIDSEPYCGHWPIGVFDGMCPQCRRHARCDAIDRAIGRLLQGAAQ